jgi:Transcriptional regulators
MPHASKIPLRSDAKFGELADKLRALVTGGAFAPGERLPTWDVLCGQFNVQRPTLKRALDIIKAEGFVEADSTRATLVAEKPPHLNRFVMLFPSSPQKHGAGGWNLFWDALAKRAAVVAKERGISIDVFFNVSAHPDCEAYHGALRDFAKKRMAGLLVVNGGELFNLTPAGTVPVVHIGTDVSMAAPSVWLDWEAFHNSAAELLLKAGRRRIAVLAEKPCDAAKCAAALARHGVEVPPKWMLSAPGMAPEYARNTARLLAAKGSRGIPDALLVTDDNLVPEAALGLMDEGRRIPSEIMVLGHCNWPDPPPLPAPVVRLGFPSDEMLRKALELAAKNAGAGVGAARRRVRGFDNFPVKPITNGE